MNVVLLKVLAAIVDVRTDIQGLRSDVQALRSEVHTLRKEVQRMDQNTQDALNRQNAKIDEVTTTITESITTETQEIKDLIAAIPTGGDPAVAAAIDAATSRLDTFATNVKAAVGGISDAVAPSPPGPGPILEG